jgi:hypothetical protein
MPKGIPIGIMRIAGGYSIRNRIGRGSLRTAATGQTAIRSRPEERDGGSQRVVAG